MSVKRKTSHTEVVYDVEDEPHMFGYWKGERAWFFPNRAAAYITDGELNDIKVSGPLVGKTGKLLASRTGYATFAPDDTQIGDCPSWLVKIASEVTT